MMQTTFGNNKYYRTDIIFYLKQNAMFLCGEEDIFQNQQITI